MGLIGGTLMQMLMLLERFSPLHMDMGRVQWNPVTSLHVSTCSVQKRM